MRIKFKKGNYVLFNHQYPMVITNSYRDTAGLPRYVISNHENTNWWDCPQKDVILITEETYWSLNVMNKLTENIANEI